MNVAIPHNIPYFSEAQKNICAEVLSGTDLVGGIQTKRFEDELCEYLGLPEGHVVLVSSGSAALYLSLWSLGMKDSVVGMPVYTCTSLARAAQMIGARSHFLDCVSGYPYVDCQDIDDLNAMIIPHTYGLPVPFSKKPSVKYIEDCAQAIGAKVDGIPVGLKGDIGIYSFYATKVITTAGQGGACFSKDKGLIDSIRDFIQFDGKSLASPGFNLQMTEVQAACGRAQFSDLENIVEKREWILQLYQSYGLDLVTDDKSQTQALRYRAVVRTKKVKAIINELKGHSIKAIVSLEDCELLSQDYEQFPTAYKLTQTTVSLPIYPALSEKSAHHIAKIVAKIC